MLYTFRKKANAFVFKYFYEQLYRTIKDQVRGCDSILDLGCGCKPFMADVTRDMKHSVGVDLFGPSLEKAAALKTHHTFAQSEVLEYLRNSSDNSFDVVMALDLIEHLEKDGGYELLSEMERVAKKMVIIFTPNGFVLQKPYENNPWQEHLSGWSFEEMKSLGFEITGIAGYKTFRGELGLVVRKPRFFWKLMSHGSQLFTYRSAKHAFAILCIKQLQK